MKFNWLKRSIRTKLAVFLLLAIAIPMLASIIITNLRTHTIVTESVVSQNAKLLYQANINLSNYLKQFYQLSLVPYFNARSSDTLYQILERGKSDYVSEEEIYRNLQSIGRSVKEVYQVYMHSYRANRAYLFTRGMFKKDDQFVSDGNIYQSPDTSYQIFPAHKSSDHNINKPPYYSPVQVITFHRTLFRIPSNIVLGTLDIDITPDVIDTICTGLYDHETERLYVLAGDGTVVYSPSVAERGTKLNEPWVQQVLHRALNNEKGSYQSKGDPSFRGVYVYDRMTESNTDWTIVKVIPSAVLYSGTRQVTEVSTILLSASLLLGILAVLVVSFWLMKPVKELTGYVNRIQSGDLNTDIRIHSEDEIGQLARRFRMMMETINNLVLREYKLELANKTNQLKALQAQVQPHFLYNALQSIGTSALQHGMPDVYKLILRLSEMMRYSMNTSEDFVVISQEIAHTSAYLELQKQRFGNKLSYKIDMHPETANVPVPRMIIQPIVENVFKHAFDPAGGTVTILINTSYHDGFLYISIQDDGPGLEPQELEQLEKRLAQGNEAAVPIAGGQHIGLGNVYLRLLLYCGDFASLKLKASSNGGLTVTLSIPYNNERRTS